jgi:probable phosphoglycerate mutase
MMLTFLRHGESEANVLNVISNRGYRHGLTDLGRRQSEDLASGLADANITRIWTSPLRRAVETAGILSEALAIPYHVTGALREFDCGIAESRADPQAWGLHREVMAAWLQQGDLAARIEGGESFLDMRDRFVPFIERLLEKEERNQALVGHGGLYLCMLPLILTNLEKAPESGFPNTAYVLARPTPDGLMCVEWCAPPVRSGTPGHKRRKER